MYVPSLRTGLALAALGGLAAAAHAQLPPAPATPAAPAPQVVRWPGGYVVVNGPEVVVRNAKPGGGSTNDVGASVGTGRDGPRAVACCELRS